MIANEHPPRFLIEASHAGETVPGEVASHFKTCDQCTSELQALDQQQAQFLAEHPAPQFRRAVMARAEKSASPWAAWFQPLRMGLMATAAVAATLVAVVALRPGREVHFKGGAEKFEVVYERQGEVRLAAADAPLKQGDALRFFYRPSRAGYLMIVDVDSTRQLTVFFPSNGQDAAAVAPGSDEPLPGSIKLDATPGAEHLFAVFRTSPFTKDMLAKRLSWDGRGDPQLACDDCEVTRVRFNKVP